MGKGATGHAIVIEIIVGFSCRTKAEKREMEDCFNYKIMRTVGIIDKPVGQSIDHSCRRHEPEREDGREKGDGMEFNFSTP
jgi:hypothetical protein